MNRSPAPRSLIADIHGDVHRLPAGSVPLGPKTDGTAFGSSVNIARNDEPTRVDPAALLPASGEVPRTSVKRRRTTLEFGFGVPFQNVTGSHPSPINRCEGIVAPARGVFNWADAARDPDVCSEAEDHSLLSYLCRKPA